MPTLQDGHDEEGCRGPARAGPGQARLLGRRPRPALGGRHHVRAHLGWLYLAVVLDAWSRRIIGWAMAPQMPAALVEVT